MHWELQQSIHIGLLAQRFSSATVLHSPCVLFDTGTFKWCAPGGAWISHVDICNKSPAREGKGISVFSHHPMFGQAIEVLAARLRLAVWTSNILHTFQACSGEPLLRVG